MPTDHSLALPLGGDYAAASASRDDFSFFTNASTDVTSNGQLALSPMVERYLDDLCRFLRAARLVQSHPDNYFQFMRGEAWAASAVHFDGSAVEAEELAHTQLLLRGFRPLLGGEDAMTRLRSLVRDGPPPLPADAALDVHSDVGGEGKALETATSSGSAPLAALNDFYDTTRRLMLGRTRRAQNDAATQTLRPPLRTAPCADNAAARRHAEQIVDLVVSHGMNPKKQHEVRIMRDTIRDLVDCCNTDVEGGQTRSTDAAARFDEKKRSDAPPRGVRVETVINMGEGKGYVSRAAALCDNLQVIGLDCNPAHKERAVERFESLVESSVSSRDGRPRVNLLYEPRGHVASIMCRVENKVHWPSLLRGHVLTCEDPLCCGSHGEANHIEREDHSAQDAAANAAAVAEATLSRIRGEDTVKLACRVCGKVVRLENTAVIMKHVYSHLQDDAENAKAEGQAPEKATSTSASSAYASPSLIPTAQQLHEWNVTLSQHAYVAKLTETFFSVTDVEARHQQNRKDAAALLLKRPRERNEGMSEHPSNSDASRATDEEREGDAAQQRFLTLARPLSVAATAEVPASEEHVTLQPTYTVRGYRVLLLMARPTLSHRSAGVDEETAAPEGKRESAFAEELAAKTSATSGPTPASYRYQQVIGTVVGYDGGADCHQVCLDGESKKQSLRFYRLPSTSDTIVRTGVVTTSDGTGQSSATPRCCIGEWRLPTADVWSRHSVAVVLSVYPPAVPSTPAVYVPSIRNTVLIGLHPCGDLGSNVCRIFMDSAARGLLLVSCCWHALTPQGFPLSQAMRSRGMTTDSISLLLATQPLDAWSTASPEGHRSSARLLFYRSLFKLLWARLAEEWARRPSRETHHTVSSDAAATCACAFPAASPHLEPTFLRRMTKMKRTLTFPEFADAVAAEYLYHETAKDSVYTPWNIGQRCAACRDAQEAFVRDALQRRQVAGAMAAAFEHDRFAEFLGLTVLRMWMCHLVESLLLLDRTLFLHEALCLAAARTGEDSAVSLVPLFDGALSPRMYGVLARRGGAASV